jgi:hypothetical protein
VRSQIRQSLGGERAESFFREVFGSDNPAPPSGPQPFDQLQNDIFTRIARELLVGVQGGEQPRQEPHSAFNRDYAGEQREAERRARERQERERMEAEARRQEREEQQQQDQQRRQQQREEFGRRQGEQND